MKKVIRNTGLLIILLLLMLQSCNKTTRSGIKQSDVIPEKEMVDVLCDLYLADGLLNYPPIRSDFSGKDSTENYTDVISKHGFTKEEVDNSMKYYFIDRPKRYAAIYDRVIEKLSGMEADVIADLSKDESHTHNLWNGERSYNLPDVGVNDPVEFSVRTEGLGEYVIKARVILYSDDQSIDPRTTVWFWYDDGTEDGHKIPWEEKSLVKNGRPVMITLSNELEDPKVTHIKGRFLDHTNQSGHWEKHALVTNITITRNTGDSD